MSNKTSTNVSQNILKGLPIQLNWMCLQFEDKQTTLPLKTQAFKDVLKNFDRQELTIDIFCGRRRRDVAVIFFEQPESFAFEI